MSLQSKWDYAGIGEFHSCSAYRALTNSGSFGRFQLVPSTIQAHRFPPTRSSRNPAPATASKQSFLCSFHANFWQFRLQYQGNLHCPHFIGFLVDPASLASTERPQLSQAPRAYGADSCDGCGKTETKLLRCTKCRVGRFCSCAECLTTAWNLPDGHSRVCFEALDWRGL